MIHQHPFIRIAMSYALGLWIGSIYCNGWIAVLLFCIALTIRAIQSLPRQRYNDHLTGLALFIATMAMGIVGWTTYLNPYRQELPPNGCYHAILLEDPKEKAKTQQCIVQLTHPNGNLYKTILYIQKDSLSSLLRADDELYIKLFNCQAHTFSYYNKKHIYSSAYIASSHWQRKNTTRHHPFTSAARATQQYLLNTLQQHTDSTGYALAAAMTLGHKAHLTGTTKQYFSASGTSHLLAVSGLHVGILFMAISFLFAPLGNNHRFKVFQQLLIIVLLWLYAFLCGLPPSIVRAVTMFSVGALGIISQQKSQGLNNLFFTAFVMLLYNPNYLFDMGFQLSFSAVIGILLYVEGRRSKVASQCKVSAASKKTNRLLTWIKDMCGVSIAAQLATLPLILYYFGTFPTYFLLTNLLMIPLGTLLVYACLLLFLISPIGIGSWLYYPIKILSDSMQVVTQSICRLPYAQLTDLHIGLFQVACLYALLLGFYRFYQRPTPQRLNAMLVCVVVWLCDDVFSSLIV